MDLERSVFLGTFYPTKPILSHYEPISMMMSSFLLLTYMLETKIRIKSYVINSILDI